MTEVHAGFLIMKRSVSVYREKSRQKSFANSPTPITLDQKVVFHLKYMLVFENDVEVSNLCLETLPRPSLNLSNEGKTLIPW